MNTRIVAALAAIALAAPAAHAATCEGSAFQGRGCDSCSMVELPAGAGKKTIQDIVFTWENQGGQVQVAYDNEQKLPETTALHPGALFTMEPADPANFWAWSDKLAWVPYPDGYKEYVLERQSSVETHVSASGSRLVADVSALPAGTPAILVKSSVFYHDVDDLSKGEAKNERAACLLYVASGVPAASAEARPAVPAKPAPEAKERITSRMTKVATGPAETAVSLAALALAAGLVALKARKA